MSWNLPDGCTDEDIEVSFTGSPVSEEMARKLIAEGFIDECLSDDKSFSSWVLSLEKEVRKEILQNYIHPYSEEVDEIFESDWEYVRYRHYGQGFVCIY